MGPRAFRTLVVWVGLAVVAFVLVQRLGGRGHGPLRFTYSKVLDLAQEKPSRIKDLKVNTKGVGQGHLTDGAAFTVNLPPDPLPYAKTLADSGVQLEFLTPTISDVWVGGLLSVLAALALIVVFWFLLMRQTQSGGSQALSFGRSRARRWADVGQKVTFDDIGGVDEAKHELMEVVDFLKNPKKFAAVGARIPKGVLLLGPPGAGKTLLARAIAGEAGVPFFHMSGSEFVEMFVGVGASRVRDLFEQAKANRPCIVFIDEIDAVGRQRFAGLGGGHDEREQTLNQLLVEMDGFEHNSGVILIAATNRPDVLDPALLRPGRFDRRIVVDHADLKGREAILKLYVKGKPLAEDVDVNLLARRTPGFSGADIANMANEAALLAARRDLPKVAMREFEEAIDRVVAGPERKSRIISDREKQILAHHEIGHALLAELLPDADPVHKASILQRGLALGYTMQLPLEDKYIVRKKELLDQITVALGGRAVEELTFQELTTGAADDLERATDLARRMVTQFGMSEELGPLSLGRKFQPPFLGRDIMEDRNYSEQVASAIDKEISTIIAGCYAKGKQLLTEHSEEVRALVTVLLERETLTGEEIRAILKGEPLPARPDGPEKPAAPGPEIVGKTPEPRAKPAEGFQPT